MCTTATAPETKRPTTTPGGIKGIHCPDCNETDSLAICCNTATVRCRECDEVYSTDQLRFMAAKLVRLAAWAEACPAE